MKHMKLFCLTMITALSAGMQAQAGGSSQPAQPQVAAPAQPQSAYGQMVEYLRMNGIIPPPSQPQPKK